MVARFVLSLDCEGKWGVADHLRWDHHATLSDERLRAAYSAIISTLDRHSIPATFAFVGLFGESREAFERLRPEVERLAAIAPSYLGPALGDIDRGSGEGWHGGWAVEAVGASATAHEIAFHGGSHVPWGAASRELASADLALLPLLSSAVRQSKTMVFPRNQLAHVDLFGETGLAGYRLAPTTRSRLGALASEFNVFEQPEADPPLPAAGPVPIPGGFFLNWQHGLRRSVPIALTLLRFRSMLARAARDGSVVHYWLHPENVASGPRTLDLLEEIVAEVARQRDAGRCEVLTQIDYVRRRRS